MNIVPSPLGCLGSIELSGEQPAIHLILGSKRKTRKPVLVMSQRQGSQGLGIKKGQHPCKTFYTETMSLGGSWEWMEQNLKTCVSYQSLQTIVL